MLKSPPLHGWTTTTPPYTTTNTSSNYNSQLNYHHLRLTLPNFPGSGCFQRRIQSKPTYILAYAKSLSILISQIFYVVIFLCFMVILQRPNTKNRTNQFNNPRNYFIIFSFIARFTNTVLYYIYELEEMARRLRLSGQRYITSHTRKKVLVWFCTIIFVFRFLNELVVRRVYQIRANVRTWLPY